MDSSFDTPHQEAERPEARIVVGVVGVRDEDPEVVARWAAAQELTRVETRIAGLRLIRHDTRTDDLRSAIDDAIEECEQRLVELLPQNIPPSAT